MYSNAVYAGLTYHPPSWRTTTTNVGRSEPAASFERSVWVCPSVPLRIAFCRSADSCARWVLAEISPLVMTTFGVAVGQRFGPELQMIDREVDAGERLARLVHDLQLGGAFRRVLDGLAHGSHLRRHEHVDRRERILVGHRIGELAHRTFG